MRGVLSYNENKVTSGNATCIAAENFGKAPNELTFHEKLNRFNNLLRWNQKVTTNTVHISLNFDPSEKLSRETLEQISTSYMNKIGFEHQPYLVYQHFDAAHPHLHIISTNVRSNAKAINLHNLGRLVSEPARKSIEKEFQLVQASSKTKKLSPGEPVASTYGKAETKRTIANVVGFVVTSYRYTSLPELNAALKQFNIIAHRGHEESIMFKKGGLVYSFIDQEGKPKGVSIKASSLHFKPTLKFIEKQFRLNEVLRQTSRQSVAQRISHALSGKPTLIEFQKRLHREMIYPVLRYAKDNRVFGITFVDKKNKVVFNGSDLFKQFGAKHIMDQLDLAPTSHKHDERKLSKHEPENSLLSIDAGSLLAPLITLAEAEEIYLPATPTAFKKKKRKRNRKL